eukprot:TRINITY_DN63688_c0_g1_i1.p1 TRINITY_DN63688_c0_g1~~TRINITY_DN63688_c0_g1_i1.p1  ORF type:complete len:543 (-),score=75.06 TRINITY_DN63688_c0_g1_i1:198-1826(-)
MASLLSGGPAADWVPLLTGTLHPRAAGLPTLQPTGWRLMGLPPDGRLRTFAALSTTPPRLRAGRELRFCLESLLAQSVTVEAVLLSVPRGRWRRGGGASIYPTTLPAWLLRFQRRHRGRLRVLRGVRDLGPGTGLIAAAEYLRGDPTAWVLAVDDDHVYHPNLLGNLLRFAAGTPGSAAGAHGWLALIGDDVAKSRAGPGLERSLRSWEQEAGPVLCGFLGVLLQRAMLDGLTPPEPGSACGDHNDIWLAAHLARWRVRRALMADPLGARALLTHKKSGQRLGGVSLTGRRRRRPEEACVAEFAKRYSDGLLWAAMPRVVLCGAKLGSPLLRALFDQAASGLGVVHAAYECSGRPSPSKALARRRRRRGSSAGALALLRRVRCANVDRERDAMGALLLAEREASTVVLLPSSEAAASDTDSDGVVTVSGGTLWTVAAAWRQLATSLAACATATASDVGGTGFCERDGWRSVTVAALACFGSEDRGIRQIYGCDVSPLDAGSVFDTCNDSASVQARPPHGPQRRPRRARRGPKGRNGSALSMR